MAQIGGGWWGTSKSLYMMVKKTCMNKLTAFTITLNRYIHASPSVSKNLYIFVLVPVIVKIGNRGVEAVDEVDDLEDRVRK